MRLLIKVGVSAALLALIIWSLEDLGDVGRVLASAAPFYLVAAFVIMTADRLLMSFKWLVLLKSRGSRLPLFDGFKIYCAATIWGTFLPATLGADAIRGYLASRHGLDQYEVFASIVVERVVGFVSALLFGMAGLVILSAAGTMDERFDPVWWFGALVLLGAVAAVLLSFSDTLLERIAGRLPTRVQQSRVVHVLRQFHSVYRGYGAKRKAIAAFFGLTLLEQYLSIVGVWVLALALHVDVGLLFVVGAVPLSLLVSRLPISIDGLGVFEGVFVLLMSLVGVMPAEALSIALAGRIVQTLVWMPWWLLYSLQTGHFGPPKARLS